MSDMLIHNICVAISHLASYVSCESFIVHQSLGTSRVHCMLVMPQPCQVVCLFEQHATAKGAVFMVCMCGKGSLCGACMLCRKNGQACAALCLTDSAATCSEVPSSDLCIMIHVVLWCTTGFRRSEPRASSISRANLTVTSSVTCQSCVVLVSKAFA